MTNAEKIKEKKEKIAIAQDRIAREQDKINRLRKEVDTLESLEVKSMLKEIDMPFDEVMEFLKSMKGPTPTEVPAAAE